MSTPAAPNDRNRRPAPGWRPSRMALLVAGIAFVIGLALFLLIWLRERNDGFYRAPGVVTAEPGQVFEPLPAPLPAGEERGNASGMGERQAQEAQSAPPPRPAPAAPAPPFPPAAVPGPPRVAMAPADIPVPIQSPAPRYPPEALRRGESGDGGPGAQQPFAGARSRGIRRGEALAFPAGPTRWAAGEWRRSDSNLVFG